MPKVYGLRSHDWILLISFAHINLYTSKSNIKIYLPEESSFKGMSKSIWAVRFNKMHVSMIFRYILGNPVNAVIKFSLGTQDSNTNGTLTNTSYMCITTAQTRKTVSHALLAAGLPYVHYCPHRLNINHSQLSPYKSLPIE